MPREFRRSTAEITKTCVCGLKTNRIIQFREAEKDPWAAFFLCDACVKGIKEMPVVVPADA